MHVFTKIYQEYLDSTEQKLYLFIFPVEKEILA